MLAIRHLTRLRIERIPRRHTALDRDCRGLVLEPAQVQELGLLGGALRRVQEKNLLLAAMVRDGIRHVGLLLLNIGKLDNLPGVFSRLIRRADLWVRS